MRRAGILQWGLQTMVEDGEISEDQRMSGNAQGVSNVLRFVSVYKKKF